MDKEIELMKAIENQIFQVHYKQVLDMWLLLPFDQNEVKLLLNNLNHRKIFYLKKKIIFNIRIKSFFLNNYKRKTELVLNQLTFPYQSKWLLRQVIIFQLNNPIVEMHSSYLDKKYCIEEYFQTKTYR